MKEETSELSEQAPGAARHGNFISYYNFHPPEERTKLLPFELLVSLCSKGDGNDPIAILDIGCNSGELTVQLQKHLEEKSGRRCAALAVDLDPILIQRAREADLDGRICYKVADVTSTEFRSAVNEFLKPLGKTKFDLGFLFSVTMWIHLNSGDEGLERSLRETASICRLLTVEPQPWKCYRSAARRMTRCNAQPFEHLAGLKKRSNVESEIVTFLEKECGFSKVFETERTNWGRVVFILQENKLNV